MKSLRRSAVLTIVAALVAAGLLALASPARATGPLGSTGTQQVLIMRAYWGSGGGVPSDAVANGLAGDVQEWFGTASHGALTLETAAADPVQITAPTTGCQADKDTLMQEAKAAVAGNGVDVSQYEDFVLYFPTCTESDDPPSWSTQAGQGVWLNGTFGLHDVLAGLGHNMGLRSAGTFVCPNGDMQSSCDFAAGDDPFDPMGQGTTAGFNAAEMGLLGWLDANENVSLADLSAGGSATLGVLHGTARTTVAFLRPGGGAQTYWLEYRRQLDLDNVLPDEATGGVLLHLVSGFTSNASGLLNFTGTGSDVVWPIPAGSSFFIREGFRISVTSTSTSGAAVTVTPPQQLTVIKNGTGAGTVSSSPAGIDCGTTCSALFPPGSTVTLNAVPATGSTFGGWTGACTSSSTSCAVTMTGARTVTATFTSTTSSSTRFEESAVALDGWGVVRTDLGTWRVSSTAGNTATFTSPVSTSLTWLTRKGPQYGKATVTIDGVAKGTINLAGSTEQAFSQVFSGLPSKAHKIVIKVAGTHAAPSTGNGVVVDGFVVGGTTTQESAKQVTFDAWKATAATGASGGLYRSTSKLNATATFAFTGTSVDWITATGPKFGKATVQIDSGTPVTVDLFASSLHLQQVRTFSASGSGAHTIRVKVLNTKNAASGGTAVPMDAVVVH